MSQTKLLIVDDEPEVLTMFGKFLTRNGYAVSEAPNALEALRVCKHHRPDIVLTDYNMPQMNGVELLKEIRSTHPGIPVILMSGKVDMRTAVTALKEEAFDFLSKPINSQDLLTTIKMALSSTKSEDTTETNANDSGKLVGPLYIRHQSGVAIVSFIRPLDQFSVQAYENAVKKLTEDGDLSGGVVLVLKDVTYINNIGLNFLLDISNRWKAANHKICFTQLSDPVQRYLRMLGYAEYFPIAFTLDEAVQLVS